jgi:uncharacterized membrane protein YjgN (DUF898 family)
LRRGSREGDRSEALRRQAREVATERLLKARGLLTTVAPAQRAVIEQVAYAVAAGVASCLLEEAARNSVIEAALRDGYLRVRKSARSTSAQPSLGRFRA